MPICFKHGEFIPLGGKCPRCFDDLDPPMAVVTPRPRPPLFQAWAKPDLVPA